MPTDPHVIVTLGPTDLPELVIDGLTGEIVADHRHHDHGGAYMHQAAAPVFTSQAEADAFSDELWSITHDGDQHTDGLKALLDAAF